MNIGFQFPQSGSEALRDWLNETGCFRRRSCRHQEAVALKIVGFDPWVKRRPHEPTSSRFVQPNILVAGECGSKVDLRDGI